MLDTILRGYRAGSLENCDYRKIYVGLRDSRNRLEEYQSDTRLNRSLIIREVATSLSHCLSALELAKWDLNSHPTVFANESTHSYSYALINMKRLLTPVRNVMSVADEKGSIHTITLYVKQLSAILNCVEYRDSLMGLLDDYFCSK